MPFPTSVLTKVSFKTCDVAVAKQLLPEVPYQKAIETQIRGMVESCAWQNTALVQTQRNAFLAAIHHAFADHRPLVLSPDHIWLLICQGFAAHVNHHAETLRRYFVTHQGKKVLEVQRPNFVKGNPHNDWQGVVTDFRDQIQQHLGANQNLVVAEFSTTTPIEQTAFEITLMDAMKPYFDYAVTLCGIPEITLEGTADDWYKLAEQAQHFRAFECGKWISAITPLLEQFVNAAEGNVDVEFWNSIYKLENVSGGPYITGWIIKFFPYIVRDEGLPSMPNPFVEREPENEFQGLIFSDVISGLSRAPFRWDVGSRVYNMDFVAGFVGIAQDAESKALRPEIGWAVCERTADEKTSTATMKAVDPAQKMTSPPKTGNLAQRMLGKKED